jgi:DNA adenine methylase
VEPFAGSLAVLLAKPAVPVEVVNDANGLLMAFYRVLRAPETRLALIDAITLTPYARDELRYATDDPALPEVERVRRFFVRINQAYVASNGIGNWTVTYQASSNHSNATKWTRFQARLWEVARRLEGVQIENGDALAMIHRMAKREDYEGVVYVDPPYLVRNGANYVHDMMSVEEHERLAVALNTLALTGRQVLVSGYDCEEYRDWYHSWTAVPLDSTKTGRPGTGSRRQIEMVWVTP